MPLIRERTDDLNMVRYFLPKVRMTMLIVPRSIRRKFSTMILPHHNHRMHLNLIIDPEKIEYGFIKDDQSKGGIDHDL